MKIEIRPVAFVRNPRIDLTDDDWGAVASVIELAADVLVESLPAS